MHLQTVSSAAAAAAAAVPPTSSVMTTTTAMAVAVAVATGVGGDDARLDVDTTLHMTVCCIGKQVGGEETPTPPSASMRPRKRGARAVGPSGRQVTHRCVLMRMREWVDGETDVWMREWVRDGGCLAHSVEQHPREDSQQRMYF
ncbi:unnamed protein product [Hydatigera taeniaeformis]|uniref:Uncharacterized protein n=1 Tax=Hydatigena taeniaeformis TaxID=6205 RepID=A0A3P7FCW4_HYDTA|nr:unnamed protein product [Hydatigera taeniaeformis]